MTKKLLIAIATFTIVLAASAGTSWATVSKTAPRAPRPLAKVKATDFTKDERRTTTKSSDGKTTIVTIIRQAPLTGLTPSPEFIAPTTDEKGNRTITRIKFTTLPLDEAIGDRVTAPSLDFSSPADTGLSSEARQLAPAVLAPPIPGSAPLPEGFTGLAPSAPPA